MKYDIFISYSRKDTAIADEICAALDKQHISYFIDRQGIGGGMEFPTIIAESILNSQLMLFLASKNSYDSKFANNEVTFAFNKKPAGSIIPYLIDNSTLPPALEFTFSSINIRTLSEHPINTVLMKDICKILGRSYINTNSSDQQNKESGSTDNSANQEKKDHKRKKSVFAFACIGIALIGILFWFWPSSRISGTSSELVDSTLVKTSQNKEMTETEQKLSEIIHKVHPRHAPKRGKCSVRYALCSLK